MQAVTGQPIEKNKICRILQSLLAIEKVELEPNIKKTQNKTKQIAGAEREKRVYSISNGSTHSDYHLTLD